MARPTFSIVTVCRNAEASITRAMKSVLNQTFDDYEYLIIDGASTDKTGEYVQKLAPTFGGKLHYTSEPDEGIYDAMNKGLEAASGQFVAFLNADDWYEPDTLATVAALIKTGIDSIGGAIRIHAQDGSVIERAPRTELLSRPFPPAMPAGHQSWFVRTELLRELGGFDTDFRIAADYELFLRVQKLNRLWVFTPKVLSNFTLGGTSYALIETAREYRQAKRANGDSFLHAWFVYLRNVTASLMVRSGAIRGQ